MEKDTRGKVNVWDTYVTKKNGSVMHFDIIAPAHIEDPDLIYAFGKEYLATKDQAGQPLTSRQCQLCHMENLRPEWEVHIATNGYFIIELEGCS